MLFRSCRFFPACSPAAATTDLIAGRLDSMFLGAPGTVPLLPVIEPVDPTAWGRYQRGEQFLEALRDGRAARAVWQALPGERWCERIAEAAAAAVTGGYGVLAVVPDSEDCAQELDVELTADADAVFPAGSRTV